MNLNETIICYKKIAEANRDSYVCLLETSYQNQMQNKAIMDRHKRKAEDYEQLAEWLEELKRFKSYKPVDKEFYKAGYTKGIEDFVTKLKEETFNGYVTLEDYFEDSIECVAVEDIVMIAEQLKEGGVE